MSEKVQKSKTVAWKLSFGAFIMAACFLIAVPSINAQQGQQGQQGQQQEYQYEDPAQQAADFSNQDLKKFAAAQTDVDDIRDEYSDALGNVEDPDKAQELQNKYTRKMINAIEDKGLSVEDYNNISRAIQGNPELQKKVESMGN